MKDLVQLIRDNPGCVAIIDNDCWYLYREHPENNPFEDEFASDEDAATRWNEQNELAGDGQIKPLGDGGYGSGNCYGGDVLQALAQIVGITVESV